jgi:hypothetical protein
LTLPPLPVVEPKAERNATKEMPGLEDIDGADAAEEDEEEGKPNSQSSYIGGGPSTVGSG